MSVVHRAIIGEQAVCRSSIHLLPGQGKILFGESRSYSASVLSRANKLSVSCQIRRKPMAACGFASLMGNVYVDGVYGGRENSVGGTRFAAVSCNDRSRSRFAIAKLRFRNQEFRDIRGVHLKGDGFRSCNLPGFVEPWLKNSHSLSAVCYAARAAHNVAFSGNSFEEPSANKSSSKQAILGDRTLKLLSGSCYLPHPAKEETGGEDAHFICADERAIGVADGVGGWADLGINAGLYAQELMSNSAAAIQQKPASFIDPAWLLEKAHATTKAQGSSTACIITLADGNIHAINLGDSGFIVVRDGSTVFQSPSQQHGFNFPYQLMNGSEGDPPSCGQVFTIPVAPGDIIVAGTDGLFDNLFKDEVTGIVVQASIAGLSPQATAEKIAALARERAQDEKCQTPFSSAAQDAGWQYFGGKLDDITVVVSYITGE